MEDQLVKAPSPRIRFRLHNSKHGWLVFTLLTMLLWGGWGVISKPVSDRLSPWQVQSASALGLLPVIGLLVFSRNLRSGSSPRRGFWLAFAAGVVATLGNVAYYQSLAAGGKAAAVTPLTALYPVVTVALAIAILRERLNLVQLIGVLVSLAAIYVFNVESNSSWLTSWLALALIPIVLWGTSALLQKCAALVASSELATLGFLLGALPVSALTPIWASMRWRFPLTIWGLVLSIGLFFALGNLTLIYAYGSGGKASVVTPLAGLYAVVTIPLAIVLLGEHLTRREGLAITLALIAAVALSYEKHDVQPAADRTLAG